MLNFNILASLCSWASQIKHFLVINPKTGIFKIGSSEHYTVKPVWNRHSKIDKTKIFMTNSGSMKVKSIAECSPWSIMQYLWPALSDNWSWKQILAFLRVAILHRFYYRSNQPERVHKRQQPNLAIQSKRIWVWDIRKHLRSLTVILLKRIHMLNTFFPCSVI